MQIEFRHGLGVVVPAIRRLVKNTGAIGGAQEYPVQANALPFKPFSQFLFAVGINDRGTVRNQQDYARTGNCLLLKKGQ